MFDKSSLFLSVGSVINFQPLVLIKSEKAKSLCLTLATVYRFLLAISLICIGFASQKGLTFALLSATAMTLCF